MMAMVPYAVRFISVVPFDASGLVERAGQVGAAEVLGDEALGQRVVLVDEVNAVLLGADEVRLRRLVLGAGLGGRLCDLDLGERSLVALVELLETRVLNNAVGTAVLLDRGVTLPLDAAGQDREAPTKHADEHGDDDDGRYPSETEESSAVDVLLDVTPFLVRHGHTS